MPSKWTETERAAYRRMAGMMINGDKQRKRDYDARVKQILTALREQLPYADNETLLEFTSTLCYTGGAILKSSVDEVAPLARGIHEIYALATAQLLGVYDPSDPEPPSQDVSDVLSALGLDDDAIRLVQEMIHKESPNRAAGQKFTGMYL